MNKPLSWLVSLSLLLSLTIVSWKSSKSGLNRQLVENQSSHQYFESYQSEIYTSANLQGTGLNDTVFKKAITGFINLKAENKIAANSSIITIIDYTRSSCEKRMWIIDVISKKLIVNTLVAHGQGSGDDLATQFSDNADSHQSSLGFYITDKVYYGKHGRSLKLDGFGFRVQC